jgi:hypothetical protein
MPHQTRVFRTYEPAQIERIMAILDRASGGRQIDREEVEQSLLEIIYATGLASDGTERSRLWQEFSSEEQSRKDERDAFRRLSGADDPIELARRDQRLGSLLRTSIGLHRRGGRWREAGLSLSSLLTSDWNSLSAAEQAEFRKALEDAASYYAQLVKRGREQKTKLDTALLCLADLYLSWTGQTIARHDVPYSIESRFIQFAVTALEPVGQYFEVSNSALSRRWERIVLQERKEERELGAALPEQEPEQNL